MLLISRYITSTPAAKHQKFCIELCAVGLWSSFGIQNDMKNHKGKHIDKNNKNHIYSSQLS